MESEEVIKVVERWVNNVVVNLNLCPFARAELLRKRVHFIVSAAQTSEQLLIDLEKELAALKDNDRADTVLLIHPQVLQHFYDYNQFLSEAEALLIQMQLSGIYQIASFHPDYQFAHTAADDVSNYTNRSPFPLLHLLPESSVEKALKNYPNADLIPERNIELLKKMGLDKVQSIYKSSFDDGQGNTCPE